MLLVFGLCFSLYGFGNFLYTDLCWRYGNKGIAIVVNKNEYHGKGSSYRLLVDYPSNAQMPARREIDVTPEYYSEAGINSKIGFMYFTFLPNKIIADPNNKWSELLAGFIGLASLFGSKKARDKYIKVTKMEPVPLRNILIAVATWRKRAR